MIEVVNLTVDTTVPTIDAAGTETSYDTTEQTITLDDLSAGAKDIYIVAKDAVGNVSQPLKVSIPAWKKSSSSAAPTEYNLRFDINGGDSL